MHNDSRLHRAAGALEERPRLFARELAHLGDDPLAPILELLVRCAEIDHEIAICLAESNHRAARDGVEHQLRCRPRLHSRRAGDHFGSRDWQNENVDETHRLVRRRRARNQPRSRADLARVGERAPHVWCRPGSSDADDEIALADTMGAQVLDRRLESIFRALLGARECLVPSGDDSLHHLRIGAVGRRHLGRVEHTETPRGAGADVEEASAAPKCRLGLLDRARDLLAL